MKVLIVLGIGVLGLFLVASVLVSSYTVVWSNPSVRFSEPPTTPIKQDCPRAEWNSHFEDYRAGLISKEDMKLYVGSCKW